MSLASETVIALPPYELIGPHDAPAIVVLGGISANRHVCASAAYPGPGWWESVAGAGRALDTMRFCLAGFDFLDGGLGGDGRPERIVTTHDQADAIAASLDEAGIARAHAVIGASYGGMVALAFAERYPDRLERLVVIGAAHRSHAMTTALRAIQRRIVELGVKTGRVHDALVLARALAMTTYRSAAEFEQRFNKVQIPRFTRDDSERLGMTPASVPHHPERSEGSVLFPVEEYLLHQGERFAATWTAERFLALSLSADLHHVEPSCIRTPMVLVAAEGDTNVPRELVEELARETGAPCQLVDLPSKQGHDAFLTEPEALGRILHTALESSRPS